MKLEHTRDVIQRTDLDLWQAALALAAHERVADATGRHSWNETESARVWVDGDGPFFTRAEIPLLLLEWCW